MKIFGIRLFEHEYAPPKYCKNCGGRVLALGKTGSRYDENTGEPLEYKQRFVCENKYSNPLPDNPHNCYEYCEYTGGILNWNDNEGG